MLNIKKTIRFKGTSKTLSKIIIILWDKPNQWIKTSELIKTIDKKSINKYLSNLAHKNISQDIGLKQKKMKIGLEAEWKIQPSKKIFKNTCEVIRKQGYILEFISTKGAKKLVDMQLKKIGLPLYPNIKVWFVGNIIIYPTIFKSFIEKSVELKKLAKKFVKFNPEQKSNFDLMNALIEIFEDLKTYDDLYNHELVNANIKKNQKFTDYIYSDKFIKEVELESKIHHIQHDPRLLLMNQLLKK